MKKQYYKMTEKNRNGFHAIHAIAKQLEIKKIKFTIENKNSTDTLIKFVKNKVNFIIYRTLSEFYAITARGYIKELINNDMCQGTYGSHFSIQLDNFTKLNS